MGICWSFLASITTLQAQQRSLATIKKELEESPNPPLYVTQVLKKRFVLDTITVTRTTRFAGIADSLAYHGKIKKVYGPFQKGKVLVQILAKLPNTFNHISQIFIDTSVFTRRIADSLADEVLTPDSSRYWSKQAWLEGNRTDSFDKQIVRNWLAANWDPTGDTNPPVLPEEIVSQTRAKYAELVGMLTSL